MTSPATACRQVNHGVKPTAAPKKDAPHHNARFMSTPRLSWVEKKIGLTRCFAIVGQPSPPAANRVAKTASKEKVR